MRKPTRGAGLLATLALTALCAAQNSVDRYAILMVPATECVPSSKAAFTHTFCSCCSALWTT